MNKSDLLKSIAKQRRLLHAALANLDAIEKAVNRLPDASILATRMKSAFDPAFARRLERIVNFPLPDSDERRKMWENVLSGDEPKTK